MADRSLAGLRVVVTRPQRQSEGFAHKLEALGARPIPFPVMRIDPTPDLPDFDAALCSLAGYRWIVFTSANGVEVVWDRMTDLGVSTDQLLPERLAAIGTATAEALRERGLTPAFVPKAFIGEDLGEGLPDVGGGRVLLARAAGSRPVLPEILERRGAHVDEFAVYRAVPIRPPSAGYDDLRQGASALTFTSPSTVRHFLTALDGSDLDPRHLPGNPATVCIGPVTAEAAEKAALGPALVAGTYTTDGLIQALVELFIRRESR